MCKNVLTFSTDEGPRKTVFAKLTFSDEFQGLVLGLVTLPRKNVFFANLTFSNRILPPVHWADLLASDCSVVMVESATALDPNSEAVPDSSANLKLSE